LRYLRYCKNNKNTLIYSPDWILQNYTLFIQFLLQ
jgi:hypothetical protein